MKAVSRCFSFNDFLNQLNYQKHENSWVKSWWYVGQSKCSKGVHPEGTCDLWDQSRCREEGGREGGDGSKWPLSPEARPGNRRRELRQNGIAWIVPPTPPSPPPSHRTSRPGSAGRSCLAELPNWTAQSSGLSKRTSSETSKWNRPPYSSSSILPHTHTHGKSVLWLQVPGAGYSIRLNRLPRPWRGHYYQAKSRLDERQPLLLLLVTGLARNFLGRFPPLRSSTHPPLAPASVDSSAKWFCSRMPFFKSWNEWRGLWNIAKE